MQLKIQRSQRQGGVVSKSVVFCVDARIFLSAEEQANVSKYKLGGTVIYNSQASRPHIISAAYSLSSRSTLSARRARCSSRMLSV